MPRHQYEPAAAILILLAVAIGGCTGLGQETGEATDTQPETQVVAQVGEVEITRAELDEAFQGQLVRMELDHRKDVYRNERRLLDHLIENSLVRQEAARRGIEPTELAEVEVTDKAKDVSDEEVRELYDRNRENLEGSYEEREAQLRNYLVQQKHADLKASFLGQLREDAGVAVLLPYPEMPFVELKGGAAGPSRGPDDAIVTIVEFSDFQCPFCAQMQPQLDALLDAYPDRVRLVYRHFPLDIHPAATPAAEASACAHEQGLFWPYHDLLFESQGQLTEDTLLEFAETIGVDSPAFRTCFDERRYQEEVAADYAAGFEAGVQGTPSFFVNGRAMFGIDSEQAFRDVIDRELARETL